MLPIVATATNVIPTQTPLINTAMPGAAIIHVPYDMVAPSFAEARVENNTRGNSAPTPEVETEIPQALNPLSADALYGMQDHSPTNLNVGAQATFLAQLLGQDVTPETAGMLVQYEKLVAFANVKYKPSNAMKPQPGPSSVFGRILQDEKATVARIAAEPQATLPAPPAPVAVAAPRPAAPQPRRTAAAPIVVEDVPASLPHAVGNYAAVAQRPASLQRSFTDDLA